MSGQPVKFSNRFIPGRRFGAYRLIDKNIQTLLSFSWADFKKNQYSRQLGES